MVPSPDDEQVAEQLMVLRAQLGSREAFSRLAARYDARLLFYVRRLLGPFREADAEDLRQEIWLIVLRKLRSLDEPAAFRTWLYRVARHCAISFLRRRRAEVPLDELAPREEPTAPDDDEQDLAFTAADAQAVYLALDRLSPSHREVLTLRFLGDLSYEQVADVLGCRVGTVRSRIHYAKAALRAAISAEPTTPDATEETLIPEAGGLRDRST
jgi:RNA polymerase sigma-70 factor (ECF subfamily)